MKKTLLALATTSALMVSGSALAAFADAPEGAAAGPDAKLTISGTLTSTNPNWMWQIPEVSQAALKDIALKKNTGVVNGSTTEFPITTSPIPILEGYMKTPASGSAPGLAPEISIFSVPIVYQCGGVSGCTVSLPVTNDGNLVGQVDAKIRPTIGMYFKDDLGRTVAARNGIFGSSAARLIEDQPWFADTYGHDVQRWVTLTNLEEADELLTRPGPIPVKNVAASRVLTMESSRLLVSNSDIPAIWSATLPITISVR